MNYVSALCFLALCSHGTGAQVQGNKSDFNAPVHSKGSQSATVRQLLTCGLNRDTSCFLDTADQLVGERLTEILVQADEEVLKTTGRADEENSPSQITKTISRIISEITELFKDGFSSFFKSAREGEEEDEVEDSKEENKDSKQANRKMGEGRKKKKKIAKLIALIKLVVLGLIIKAKITLLLKLLSAALQVKFFLVALAGLILNAARFYLDLKQKHHPQKVIYYEHAQHQHHYEDDHDWSSAPGGGYWGRSYDEEEAASAHDLAYSRQKPYKAADTKSSSWFG